MLEKAFDGFLIYFSVRQMKSSLCCCQWGFKLNPSTSETFQIMKCGSGIKFSKERLKVCLEGK